MHLVRKSASLAFRIVLVGFTAVVATVSVAREPTVETLRSAIEMSRCKQNLRELLHGLREYRKEHLSYPARIGLLFPKYVRREAAFCCPASYDSIRLGRGYRVDLAGKATASAYVLSFASLYPEVRAARGSMAPVIVCESHVRKMIDELGGNVLLDSTFQTRHGDPPYLVIRENGQISEVTYLTRLHNKLYTTNDL